MEKKKICEGRKLYNSKADLWEAIKTTMLTETADVKKRTKSLDNRLLAVIEKKVHYIEMLIKFWWFY